MYNVKLRTCALQIVGDADLRPLRSLAIAFTHQRLLLLPISLFCSLLELFGRLIDGDYPRLALERLDSRHQYTANIGKWYWLSLDLRQSNLFMDGPNPGSVDISIVTGQSSAVHRHIPLRRGWVSQPVNHTSGTSSDCCQSIFQYRRFGVEIQISTCTISLE